MWLEHRIDVATRGAGLLDKKRRALVQEHRRLRVLARQTEAEWNRLAADAEVWLNRTAVMAGEEKVAMLAARHPQARVTILWRSSMGVTFASQAQVDLGASPGDVSGGSAAADVAVESSRLAVEAAVNDAVARSALSRVGHEVALTARRQRALERRWMPALTEALNRLNGALDELEREETTRAVWAMRHQSGSGRGC